ncbi:S6 family peptidase, partial [Moraxella sp.]|uniref:S6 family peptidase n=1 Tax=Moraxella sp. TaxID=479 RepID=UPI0026DC3215
MKNRPFKPSLLALVIASVLSSTAQASTVRGDVDYQYFRDLAENKGKFYVGASNIDIFNKQGEKIGTMLQDIPMIDFSVITRGGGFATLTKPQYIVSVEHNTGYRSVQFGDSGSENPDNHHFNYQLVARNDYDPNGGFAVGLTNKDYHTPRLAKLVTETAPTEQSLEKDGAALKDRQIFPVFIRAGSGTQYVLPSRTGEKVLLSNPYNYLIGGTTLNPTTIDNNRIIFAGNVFDDVYSPLSSNPQRGDSGSGMFGWDSRLGRWVYVAALQSGNDDFTVSIRNYPEYGDLLEKADTAGTIVANGQELVWTPDGNSSVIRGGEQDLTVKLADTTLASPTSGKPHIPSLHHGKTFHITGENNTLTLT